MPFYDFECVKNKHLTEVNMYISAYEQLPAIEGTTEKYIKCPECDEWAVRVYKGSGKHFTMYSLTMVWD